MLNVEKFEDEVLALARDGNIFAVVNGKPLPCKNVECKDCDLIKIEGYGCLYRMMSWLLSEYEEPKVDWSKVAVDTPILVSVSGGVWRKKYFARYVDGIVYAWNNGATSWSSTSGYSAWKYAKLAEDGE